MVKGGGIRADITRALDLVEDRKAPSMDHRRPSKKNDDSDGVWQKDRMAKIVFQWRGNYVMCVLL